MSIEGNPQTAPETVEEKPLGEQWLELLDYGHLKDMDTGHKINGEPVLAKDFHKLCEEHAGPVFKGFANLSSDNPKYEAYKNVLRKIVRNYLSVDEAKPQE